MKISTNRKHRYAAYKRMVTRYVNEVLDGSVTVGRYELLAVKRWKHDLARQRKDKSFRYRHRPEAACYVIDFMVTCLKHSVGQFANEPFVPAPFQMFILWNLFGWLDKKTKKRRFRNALLDVARKNGKTTLCAALALFGLVADHEASPEVYCVATKRDQAKLLFRAATQMIDSSAAISKVCKVTRNTIDCRISDGFIAPLGKDKNQSGLNSHFILCDELHEWSILYRDLYERLQTGSVSREQPLMIRLTTAGDATSIIWQQERDYSFNILDNLEDNLDDTYFSFICQLDPEDNPFDESVWRKANPNLGVTVPVEVLQNQANQARIQPQSFNQFKRYHLNQYTEAASAYITSDLWNCGSLQPTFIEKHIAYAAVDLSLSGDLTAIALVQPVMDETGHTTFNLKAKCFTCSGRKSGLSAYIDPWIREGLITECHGETIDHELIRQELLKWSKQYKLVNIAFDPQYATYLMQRLEAEDGLVPYKFINTPGFFTPPLVEFNRMLQDGRIYHGNDPVLSWQFKNLQVEHKSNGKLHPRRVATTNHKIDAAIASLMAFAGACRPVKAAPKVFTGFL